MPRVHSATARKEYPDDLQPGKTIQKGDRYFYWTPYRSRMRKSLRRPRQSELTSSDKLARVYEGQEALEDALAAVDAAGTEDKIDALNDLADQAEQTAEEWRDVASEYEESADNLEEYFSGSSQIDEIRDKASNLNDAADELDSAVGELRGCISELEDLSSRVDGAQEEVDALSEADFPSDSEYMAALEAAQEALEEAQMSFDEKFNEADQYTDPISSIEPGV